MSIVAQISMFSWDEIEKIGDLERLRILVDHLPDESLLHMLAKERGRG